MAERKLEGNYHCWKRKKLIRASITRTCDEPTEHKRDG